MLKTYRVVSPIGVCGDQFPRILTRFGSGSDDDALVAAVSGFIDNSNNAVKIKGYPKKPEKWNIH